MHYVMIAGVAYRLLEEALMDANKEREKNILEGSPYSFPSPAHSDQMDDNISGNLTTFMLN
jgi:hypothetical protein